MRIWAAMAVAITLTTGDLGAVASPAPGDVVVVAHQAPATFPRLGPRFAPVTIEFFVDSRSSSSRWLYKELRKLADRHPRRLRIIFRFPFTDTFSNASRVAFRMGRFPELADTVYGGKFRRHNEIESIARSLGMDWKRFDAELKASYHADESGRDRYHARRRGVQQLSSSRPALLINAAPFRGRRRSLESLELAYDNAYRHAQTLLDRGVRPALLYRTLLVEAVNAKPPVELPIGSVDGGSIQDEERENHPAPAGPLTFESAHFEGPSDAAITLSWFCSLQSSACSRLFSALREARKAFPTELRLAFFHAFDPADEEQPSAQLLHRAALCAGDQGDFFGFMKQVYLRRPRGKLKPAFVEEIANRLGLDPERLIGCTESNSSLRRLGLALEAATTARVTRTPTLIVGGLAYLGSRDFFQVMRLVEMQQRPGTLGRWLWPAAEGHP